MLPTVCSSLQRMPGTGPHSDCRDSSWLLDHLSMANLGSTGSSCVGLVDLVALCYIYIHVLVHPHATTEEY